MSQKTMVVTGATSGIGEATATALAAGGHRVGIVARNPAKADVTRARILERRPGAEVDVFLADLSRRADVDRVGREVVERYGRLDVLVNNAGINTSSARPTEDGIDEMLAVNVVAPVVLSTVVLPALVAAAPARIVTVASEAHRIGFRVGVDDLASLGGYSGGSMRAYGRSKLLVILLTFEMARRLAGTGVTANCLCPGLVATNLAEQPAVNRMAGALSRTPFVRTPEQGARLSVAMATEARYGHMTGRFITSTPGMQFLPPLPALGDIALQTRLWEAASERYHFPPTLRDGPA